MFRRGCPACSELVFGGIRQIARATRQGVACGVGEQAADVLTEE
jgi:hypothetical protein